VTTLSLCLRAMKNMLTAFADSQTYRMYLSLTSMSDISRSDLAGTLNILGSRIRYTAEDDITTRRVACFTRSIEEAVLRRLFPPHRYVNFRYQQLSTMPVAHAAHCIIFGCSIPEQQPKTGSPQAIAIDAFYHLLDRPYQPHIPPTLDVSKVSIRFTLVY
jgi:hypothetical protein